jgi:glycosyltransferase involved in cell wall biosynthesis
MDPVRAVPAGPSHRRGLREDGLEQCRCGRAARPGGTAGRHGRAARPGGTARGDGRTRVVVGGGAVDPAAGATGGAAGDPWPVLAPDPVAPVDPVAPPTLSVVVAAYQAGCTLAAALGSVLDQTYPALEVVVCDDGSTDSTAEVLAGFGDRVRAFRQPNRGEAAAKNAAVHAARGDYVVVLDADDVFLPRRLEALGWLATRRPDLDVLTTDATVEAAGRPVRRAYHPGWQFPVDDQRAAILDRNFVLGLAAVRRERWLAAGGFDEDLAHTADWEFWQRLVLSGSRIGLVDAPLARYRLAAGTLSANRIGLVQARLEVLRRAARRPDLTPHERAVVAAAIERERRDLVARLARDAVDRGGWEARRRSATVVLGRGFGARARLGALAAVVSPRMAARRRLRSGGTTEIGSGLRVPASEVAREDGGT